MSDPLRGFDPRATYDVASLDYEQASRAFWEQVSSRTVALASPMPSCSGRDRWRHRPSVVLSAQVDTCWGLIGVRMFGAF